MKNKILIITFFLLGLSAAFAAKEDNKKMSADAVYSGTEAVFVYDKNNKLLFTFSEERVRAVLAEIIGEGAGNAGAENPFSIFQEKPEDAEILYRYVFITGRGFNVNLYIFSNYKAAYMDNIAVVKSLLWELSDKDYEVLRHPEKLQGKSNE